MFIYENQTCKVKWGGSLSEPFTVRNGVRQGAVSSSFFFAVYIDELLKILRRKRIGCHINGFFLGAFLFADDIILLSASRNGLQTMVNTCDEFAKSRNLSFGTNPVASKSKTKCLLFSKKVKEDPKEIVLAGNCLPWVSDVTHLGTILQGDNSFTLDMNEKRRKFNGIANSLLQEFHYASAEVLLKFVETYASSLYGSQMWSLFSPECTRLFTSWNILIRQILHLDRTTHRFLIEPLSNKSHIQATLVSRFVRFIESLENNRKFCLRFLLKINLSDMRTVVAQNMVKVRSKYNKEIMESTKLDSLQVKKNWRYWLPTDDETLKIKGALELKSVVDRELEIPGFSQQESKELFDLICST